MKRILLVLAAAALMVAMVVATAAPAFARPEDKNPKYTTTPAASVYPESGGVDTYRARVAEGYDPPKSDAKGGEPLSIFNRSATIPQ